MQSKVTYIKQEEELMCKNIYDFSILFIKRALVMVLTVMNQFAQNLIGWEVPYARCK